MTRNVVWALNRIEQGSGRVHLAEGDQARLVITPQTDGYSNAQLDDYSGLPRRAFPWRPPVRFGVEARFGAGVGRLVGTAGFGFWNAPYGGDGRLPCMPAAVWFFYGGPATNMAFAQGTSGHGWKAATIHSRHPLAYALLPFAPLGMLLMRSQGLYARLWPMAERVLNVAECELPRFWMDEFHRYAIEWGSREVVFRVANEIVHIASVRVDLPLGLVIWIDNQFLVATPQGQLKSGIETLRNGQRLEVKNLQVGRVGES